MIDPTDTSATPPALGDDIPAALRDYYRDLDDGRFAAAATHFGSAARYAVPAGGLETQPRVETVGRPAIRSRFEARGLVPRRHDVRLCVVEGARTLVEGVVTDLAGSPTATFVASATTDAEGQLIRYLAYSCEGARDPLPTDHSTTSGQVREVLDRYFHALDDGRFEEAADCFSADVLYSHPPYRHTGIDSSERVEFRGRPALLDAFRSRGRQTFGHVVLVCVQRGPHALLEGAVHDLPDGGSGSFISSVSLDHEGLMKRYVSFYCEPSVAWV